MWKLKKEKNVEVVDFVKSFPTSILIAQINFDTAENKPFKVWITDFSDHIYRSHAEPLVEI